MKDDKNERRPTRITDKKEDNQKGRQPKWKSTKMEDNQNGRRPKWKAAKSCPKYKMDEQTENIENIVCWFLVRSQVFQISRSLYWISRSICLGSVALSRVKYCSLSSVLLEMPNEICKNEVFACKLVWSYSHSTWPLPNTID